MPVHILLYIVASNKLVVCHLYLHELSLVGTDQPPTQYPNAANAPDEGAYATPYPSSTDITAPGSNGTNPNAALSSNVVSGVNQQCNAQNVNYAVRVRVWKKVEMS